MKRSLNRTWLGKGLAAVMAVIMAGSLTACGSAAAGSASAATKASESSAAGSSEAGSSEAGTAADGSVEGALKGVTLTFGTSGLFAPFSYYDEDGNLIGFDIDFCNALKDYLGFEIEGEMQAMDYSALSTSLAEGKLDFGMAALCATDERREVMGFTKTYCDSGLSVGINKETSPKELTSVDMLTSGDYKVAVEKGTASHMYMQKIGVPESALEVHDEITTAYESLEQGKVDAVIQDTPGLAYYIKTAPGTKAEIVGEPFNQGQSPYAVAVSFKCEGANPGITETFDRAIDELIANGTFEELSKKWLE
ncbi:polar amino acid transport system substrate-binding protein [Lachnospiraceae bacterium]|nr:polar amino acid transport system substrate-binding protein [Lachnospiraceae bacterium]